MNLYLLRHKTRRPTRKTHSYAIPAAAAALLLVLGFAVPPNVNASALDAPSNETNSHEIEPHQTDIPVAPNETVPPSEDASDQLTVPDAEEPAISVVPADPGTPSDQLEPVEPVIPVEPVTPVDTPDAEVADDQNQPATPESLQRAVAPEAAEIAAPQTRARPTLQSGEALIAVHTDGVRDMTRARNTQPLAGVELALYERVATRGAPATVPINADWASCTSDADGICYFVVPQTGTNQPNRDRRFAIVQTAAPEGWYMNSELRITPTDSNNNNLPDVNQPYVFNTGINLRAGNTYTSGNNFMHDQNLLSYQSLGAWQSSIENPEFVCRVGLRVALVLDLSGSVRETLDDLKTSAIGFIEALEGTGSSVALFTFSTTAPSENNPGLTMRPVDGNVAALTAQINSYTANGGTNWDQGIYQVAKSEQQFDLALMVTDGMPTIYRTTDGGTEGLGVHTRMHMVESAIFSANTLKAKADPTIPDHLGTRLVMVGVGEGVVSEPSNFEAVSGRQAYDPDLDNAKVADYFQVEWEQLQKALEDIAETAVCSASVQIVKQVQPTNASEPVRAGSGWNFALETTGDTFWSEPGLTNPQQQTRVTGVTGDTRDLLQFAASDAPSVEVSLTEVLQSSQIDAGWSLDSVTCLVNGLAIDPLPANPADAQISVNVGDSVVCTFTNVQGGEPGLSLVKRGWVPAPGDTIPTQEILRGSIRLIGSNVTWSYDITNNGGLAVNNITLFDDRLGAIVTCPASSLAAGTTMRCWATGPLADTRFVPPLIFPTI